MPRPPTLLLLDILFKLINFFCHCFAPGVGGLICSALIEEKAWAGTSTSSSRDHWPTNQERPKTSLHLSHSLASQLCTSLCFLQLLPRAASAVTAGTNNQNIAQPSTDCPLRNYASSVTLSRGRGGAEGEIGKSVIAQSRECRSLGPNPPNPISLCAPTGVRRCNRAKKRRARVISEYPFLWRLGRADAGA